MENQQTWGLGVEERSWEKLDLETPLFFVPFPTLSRDETGHDTPPPRVASFERLAISNCSWFPASEAQAKQLGTTRNSEKKALSEQKAILGAALGLPEHSRTSSRDCGRQGKPNSQSNSRSNSRNWWEATIGAQILGAIFFQKKNPSPCAPAEGRRRSFLDF